MKFQWDIFLAALGLALVLEGLPYFLSPEMVKKLAIRLLDIPGRNLRLFGLLSIACGLALVAVSRLLI